MSVADVVTRVSANSKTSDYRPGLWRHYYGRRLVAVDVFGVVVAVGIAQWLRFGLPVDVPTYRHFDYVVVSFAIAGVWLWLLTVYRTRSPRIIGAGAEEYRRVWLATISVFGGVAIVSMLFKLDIARGYLMIALPIGVVCLLLGRFLARRVVAFRRKTLGKCMTRVLVVGNVAAVKDLVRSLTRDAAGGYRVVGACLPMSYPRDTIEVPGVGSVPVHGDEADVADVLSEIDCDAVAVTATERLDGRGIRDLSWQLDNSDVDLMVAPGVVDVAGPRLTMRPVAGFPLIHVEKPQYNGAKRFQKRAFDVIFASLVLVLGSPLLLTVAAAVYLTSRGPVFYRSERIGIDGKPFQMIKFRTMVDGADRMVDSLSGMNESEGGVLFKIRKDPRVTPLGRILRKYSIDELPQFINVLKRDMSVVGPRPPLAREVKTYDDHVRRRLLVLPGITGLWQVSGRSDLSWEDSVRLDLFYVENWSMMADLLIVVKTVKAMIAGSGAY